MGLDNIKIDVLFVMRDSCDECKEVLRIVSNYMEEKNHLNFTIIDLDNNSNFKRRHFSITPSIWVNDKMWSAGKFNVDRFNKKINELISVQ